ncbi:MAG: ORF6N domain-containing protein [Lentisphaerae bacterium]|nr:ORF6N domain-containing protein [Lentisphaerota bacterium]
MFQLEPQEVTDLKSQIVISSWGGSRALPYAFTEQGVAMLSSVLNSRQAIEVNIAIMRAFVRLRAFLSSQAKLDKRLRHIEQEVASHGKAIGTLFDAMQQLTNERPPAIGFQYLDGGENDSAGSKVVRERGARYRTARKAKRSLKP